MAEDAEVWVPGISLGDITQAGYKCITVKLYDEKERVIGTLKIGKRRIAWVPKNKQQGFRLPIETVARYLMENGDKY
jgi:hypothetical protein